MPSGYDGSIRLNLDIDTKEAEKGFDALGKWLENRTEEITKSEGQEIRDFVENMLSSAKEITPEMEKIANQLLKQADIVDKLAMKQDELQLKVDSYKTKYDKLTEAMYAKQLEINKLEEEGLRIRDKVWTDYETKLINAKNKIDEMRDTYARLEQEEAEIIAGMKNGTVGTEAVPRLNAIRSEMNQLDIKTGEAQADFEKLVEEFEQIKLNPTLIPGLKNVADKMSTVESAYDRLAQERDNLGIEAETKLANEAQELSTAYESAHANANSLSYALATVSQEEEHVAENATRTRTESHLLEKVIGRLWVSIRRVAGKFKEMAAHSRATHRATDLFDRTLGRIRKKIWGMIRRVFIFSVMTKALRKIRSLLSNIFSTSPEMTEYFGKIKANLLTAFAPLWDYVIPIFKQVLAVLVTATQRLAEIMSAIFGKTIKQSQESAKALEAQAKATDKTAKATDKLNKTLGHLDELNTDISTENDTSAGDEETSSLVFDDFAISPEIMERVNRFKELLSALFEPLKKSWDKNGPKVKRAATRMFNSLISLAGSVGDSFMEVWTNGSAEEMFDNLFEIISNIMDIVSNLADAFKKAWDKAGLGTRIIQHIFDIINNILSHVKEITKAIADWAAELDFEPILQAFDDLLVALEPFIDMTLDGLDFIVKEILLPLAEWAIEEAIPAALDAVSGAITGLKDVAEALKPFGKWLWEEFLKPIGEWTGSVIIGALDTLSGAFESLGKWIKENNGPLTEFLKLMTLVLVPVAAGKWIIGLLAGAFTAVKTALVGAGILSGGGLIGAFLGPTGIIALLGLLVIAGGKGEEVIEDLKGAFKGLGDFLSGVFTGNWEKALLGILNLCVNFTNLLIDMINGAINAIVRGAASINGFTIPGIGTINFPSELENFDLGIPRIKEITHLAHGTVVPPSSREFLAMLGDNNQETEVVSPLSTMKDALLEALEAYSGNTGEQQIILQVDGNDLFRWLVQKNKETYLQTGQNMLIY